MSQLYWDTVTENMRTVLSGFTQSALGDRFYLAGGTALSLQLDHQSSPVTASPSPTRPAGTLPKSDKNAFPCHPKSLMSDLGRDGVGLKGSKAILCLHAEQRPKGMNTPASYVKNPHLRKVNFGNTCATTICTA